MREWSYHAVSAFSPCRSRSAGMDDSDTCKGQYVEWWLPEDVPDYIDYYRDVNSWTTESPWNTWRPDLTTKGIFSDLFFDPFIGS